MAKEIEHDARNGKAEGALERVQQMLRHYKKVASELRSYQ